MNIQQNVQKVQSQINGRAKVVAASKYVDAQALTQLYQSGIKDMGENRADAMLEKMKQLEAPVTWHFIGTLQTRKVRDMINEISCLHSLDRLSLAKEIEKHRETPLDCLVQVNVSGEGSKQGITPDALEGFLEALKPYGKINVTGLMIMAPNADDEAMIRSCFRGLRQLRDQVIEKGYGQVRELSMGMSNDYLIALEEGATMVRLGSVLFED